MMKFKKIMWFRNLKLQQKLLVSYIILILLPMGSFMYLSYNKVYTAIESILKYSAEKSFQQTGDFLSKKLDYAISVADILAQDKKVQRLLSTESKLKGTFSQIEDSVSLQDLQVLYTSFNDVYKIKFYINQDLVYINNQDFINIEEAKKTEWYKYLLNSESNIVFEYLEDEDSQNAAQATLSIIRQIKDNVNLTNSVGIIRVDIRADEMRNILNKSTSTPNSLSMVLNPENKTLAVSNSNIKKEWQITDKLFSDFLGSEQSKFGNYNLANTKVLLGCQNISSKKLRLVSVIPYNEIIEVTKRIRIELFSIMIVLSAIAYFVAYLISYSIVKRLKILARSMRKIQGGEFEKIEIIKSKDEIGELMEDFNFMSDKLSFLVKEQFRVGQEAKNYELKALQEQINPHFLYNTLDLINWTAINNNVPEISNLVKALSKFYKLSLSKGKDIVTIKEELEHVSIYMEIQNQRFEDAFEFSIDADEKIYEYSTIKIILQPIIENSVLHGILKKPSRKGRIHIKVNQEGGNIIFKIQDDGIGMSAFELDNINHPSAQGSQGYGVRNINERIKLYYGEDYGLYFNSDVELGTEVRVVIPAISEKEISFL